MRYSPVGVVIVAGTCLLTTYQVTALQDVRFDVVSVRPSAPRGPQTERVLPTRLEFVNVPLQVLLLRAFRLQAYELVAPDWAARERFDIRATYPAGSTSDQYPEMLRALLIARFGLVAHVDAKRMDHYELVVADGGPRMPAVEAVDDLTTAVPPDPSLNGRGDDTTRETAEGPVRSMMIPLGQRTVTSRMLFDTWTTAERTFFVDATRITMTEFAKILATNVDAPVVDGTRLSGLYRFKVELDANQASIRRLLAAGMSTTVRGTPLSEPTGVSTFDAVKALGLELRKRNTPVNVLVVDKIERLPTAN